MQNAARYREFAETLVVAAQNFAPEARQAVLSAAAAWTALAEAEEKAERGETNVVSMAEERRLRAL